jgi:hypothetical protein
LVEPSARIVSALVGAVIEWQCHKHKKFASKYEEKNDFGEKKFLCMKIFFF